MVDIDTDHHQSQLLEDPISNCKVTYYEYIVLIYFPS